MKKPAGRSVLGINALIGTAKFIMSSRAGKPEALRAQQWALWLDEEKYVQLALLTDWMDEVMSLLRFTDTDEAENLELQVQVRTYQEHVSYLFGDSAGCFNVQGYTRFAANAVQTLRVLPARRRTAFKTCGGPGAFTDDM
eukprot:1915610-Alexandrium_andersonii.AAC.1